MLVGGEARAHDQNPDSTPAAGDLAAIASSPQKSSVPRSQLKNALRVEWLGQTLASLCWIASVLTYGITSVGDWLQLAAASAWLVANIASIVNPDTGEEP